MATVNKTLNRILIVTVCAATTSLFTATATSVCGDGVGFNTYNPIFNGVGGPSVSCQVNNLIFGNFTLITSSQGGATAQTPLGITVDTIGSTTGPFPASFDDSAFGFPAGETGLLFSFSTLRALAGQGDDATIGFTISSADGSRIINDTGLAQVSGVSPDGSASVSEQGCGPAPCIPGTLSLLTFDTGTTTKKTAFMTFTPAVSMQVVKDINVLGGSSGFAELSLVADVFSTTVPEPRTISLFLGLCLAVGLAFRKRLQNVRG